ncbi:MAG: pitrilysin family protein [Moraxella sp.]|nr:pitrilysin family protein [Moraxella sp.]
MHTFLSQHTKFTAKPIKICVLTAISTLVLLVGCTTTNPAPKQIARQSAITLNKEPAYNAQVISTNNTLTEYTLDNGLKVVLKQDKRAPLVMTQIWYNVGSSDEKIGKGGLAHFLEHMMFKDAKGLTADDYHRLIAHFGGSKNAFTSYDYTAYYEMLPANQYPVALQIEANRMDNLILRPEEVATEKQVIQEERRQRIDSNPMAQAFEEFNAIALPNSPKGLSVIGSMAEIENLDFDDLSHWYDVWYSPNNATLVMVGDFDVATAKEWIDKYFGKLPTKTLPARPNLRQSSHRGYNLQTRNIDGVQVPSLIMAFNVPSLTTATGNEAYALSLMNDVLDGGLSARFEQSLVREQNLLSSVSARYDIYSKGDGLFIITATPHSGVSLETAEQAIIKEIDHAINGTILDSELQRAQTNLTASLVFSNDSIANQAQILGMLNSIGLDSSTLDRLPNELAKVSVPAIQSTAKHYLTKDNLTVMYVYPKDNKGN